MKTAMAENRALSIQQIDQLERLNQAFERNAQGAQVLVNSIGANLTGMAKAFKSLANTLKDMVTNSSPQNAQV